MKLLRHMFIVLLILAVAAGAAAMWWLQRPLALTHDPVEVAIDPGTTPRDIAEAWVKAGVQTSPILLYQWFRWSGQDRKIRAGSFEVTAGITPVRLLAMMVRGDETFSTVRFGEGWTFRQMRAEMAKAADLKPTTALLTDAQVMEAIGAPGVLPEGRFYPDTYTYSRGSTDVAVLKRAYTAMQQRLAVAWADRSPDTPLKSADEALTLASIVEKESGVAADRALVSAVFANRLRAGMPLQTDPTVIYGLGESFDGNLRKRDLQADTPYNTYLHPGLPPSPIAMPGKGALFAAVHPAPSKALYFVSRGDGSSEFSESLADHNRAVNRFQRAPSAPKASPVSPSSSGP